MSHLQHDRVHQRDYKKKKNQREYLGYMRQYYLGKDEKKEKHARSKLSLQHLDTIAYRESNPNTRPVGYFRILYFWSVKCIRHFATSLQRVLSERAP